MVPCGLVTETVYVRWEMFAEASGGRQGETVAQVILAPGSGLCPLLPQQAATLLTLGSQSSAPNHSSAFRTSGCPGTPCPLHVRKRTVTPDKSPLLMRHSRHAGHARRALLLVPDHQQGGAPLVAQMVKNLPAVEETWVQSLGREDPLEKGMATYSSILAWRFPWTEEPSPRGCQESDTLNN